MAKLGSQVQNLDQHRIYTYKIIVQMEREDHHEILIQQLRAEIYELKKSEEDYYLLQEQLNRLETKYRLLNDEKISNDREHVSKHDSYSKLIHQTKHQLVVLEDELKYKQADLKQIEFEGSSLKKLCEDRNNQIQRLRMERSALMAEDQELKSEDQRIDHQASRVHSEINSFKNQYQKVQNDIQHTLDKNREYEGYLNELVNDSKSFMEDIRTLQDKISNQEVELEDKSDQVRAVEKQISDATSATKQLEVDIAQVTSQNQKSKGEISHYIRLSQSEISRANELIKSIQILQTSLKMIQEETLEVSDEIKELIGQNTQITDINFKLDLDNQNCQKHIQLLGSQNQCLMQELDKLSEEDQVVRTLLLRKKGLQGASRSKEMSVKLSRTSHQSRF